MALSVGLQGLLRQVPISNQEVIEPPLIALFNSMQELPNYMKESQDGQSFLQICLFLSTWYGLVIEPNIAMCDTLEEMKPIFDIDGIDADDIDFGIGGNSAYIKNIPEYRKAERIFMDFIAIRGLSVDDLILYDMYSFVDDILVIFHKED